MLPPRHIQHNRLWQREIARNKTKYDRMTVLYDAIVERQAILETLSTNDAGVQNTVDVIREVEWTKPRSELEAELRAREKKLLRQIRQHLNQMVLPEFIRVERVKPHRWVIGVPIYTDVASESFLQSFEDAVERIWCVKDGADEFRVELSIRRIAAEQLYRERANSAAPEKGKSIDLKKHIGLFPKGAGALTTGSHSTHVRRGSCIVLGPQDIKATTLAHEFGHVLGFRDGYVRGYRDLGPDGYEIREIVPDLDDIMSSPAFGSVHRYHFELLLAEAGR